MSIVRKLAAVPFWQQVLLALVLGTAVGALIYNVGSEDVVEDWLDPFGGVYVNLLKLIVLPLVFSAIVVSLGRLRRIGGVARLTAKTIGWFVITSTVAVAIGLVVGLLIRPGDGVGDLSAEQVDAKEVTWTQVLGNLVPGNPVQAMSEGNVLGVVFFAGLFGAALVTLGERGRRLSELFEELYLVAQKLVWWVVRLAPIGSFFLIASVVATYGPGSLAPLAKFTGALYLAAAVMLLAGYPLLLAVFARVSPVKFLRNSWPALQFAFVSASSLATLPISQRVSIERNGVQPEYTAFAQPLGATVKFDGCGAIYPALAALFVSQYTGTALGWTDFALIAVAAVIGQLGIGGTPGPALVALTLTLTTVGLPLEAIGYLLAVDRVLDMARTTVNVAGQLAVPVLVARSEGILDKEVFDRPPVDITAAPATEEAPAEERAAEQEPQPVQG
ncbi:dicarboxylate/amino acid:cation symporter [Thermomonospora catenispora]|uniref:dicarboxylate/amino acid:cation symporter n=1 Tax=Thermomonospora catenispora TaxID=2493090 RepID=UPI001375A536|nr:dicarboxylate/amino acid:cation symporter [Thermomonospora catenispora]